jgi:hypothetical protein
MTPADRIHVYLGEPLRRLLDARATEEAGYTASSLVNTVADRYQEMVRRSMPALSEREWMACADALNGVWLSSDAGGASLTLATVWAEIADADRLNGLGEKWGIDAQALARRLREAPYAEVVAVVDVVETLWSRPNTDWSARLRELGALPEDTEPRTGESTAPLTADQIRTLVELVETDRRADYDTLCAALGVTNAPALWIGTERRLRILCPSCGQRASETTPPGCPAHLV